MTEVQQHSMAETHQKIFNFDLGLKKGLFGYDGTHIFVFGNGFNANLDAENPEHPLQKVPFLRSPPHFSA